jgi:membrane fusion protein, macrolide-specific efflux system
MKIGRRRISGWWLLPIALGLGGLAIAKARRDGDNVPLDSPLVVTVKRGTLSIDIVETGRVEAREKIELKSKVAGQVAEVRVQAGARVSRGDLLVVLDPTDYEREVARAEAEIAQAEAAVAFARQKRERSQRGVNENILPVSELDAAEHEFRAGSAALQSATVALTAARDRVRYTKIVAPITGTVIQRGIEAGEVVTPGVQATFEGKPLLTLADLETLLVKVDLNQIEVAKVQIGQKVSVSLDALPGKSYEARVTNIAPASVRRDKKDVDVFPIEAELEHTDVAIKPGMTADVRIHLEARENVLTLPIEAVIKTGDTLRVTRLVVEEKKTRKEPVDVTVGARNDREYEIVSGIAEGERVLIDPASAAANEMKL